MGKEQHGRSTMKIDIFANCYLEFLYSVQSSKYDFFSFGSVTQQSLITDESFHEKRGHFYT
jgi:hypothetical protein